MNFCQKFFIRNVISEFQRFNLFVINVIYHILESIFTSVRIIQVIQTFSPSEEHVWKNSSFTYISATRKIKLLQSMIDNYKESFTCHGLSRIYTGKKWEQILWFVLLTACMLVIVYLVSDLAKHYLEYNVRTEVRVEDAEKVPLPTITACSWVCVNPIRIQSLIGSLNTYILLRPLWMNIPTLILDFLHNLPK